MEEKHLENASVTIPYKEFKKLLGYKEAFNNGGVVRKLTKRTGMKPYEFEEEVDFISKQEVVEEAAKMNVTLRENIRELENEKENIRSLKETLFNELEYLSKCSVRVFRRWRKNLSFNSTR